MTALAGAGPGAKSPGADSLEAGARALAEGQQDLERAAPKLTRFFEPPRLATSLSRAKKHLGASTPTAPAPAKAAEWFLDNFHLIRRVARQVEEEMPRGFVRHLPQLASGPAKGRPRIDVLARALVTESGMALDLSVLRRFVDAYQQVTPLTIAELWALPTMLRSTVLQHLLRFLQELDVPLHEQDLFDFHPHLPHFRSADIESISLDPGTGVERSIRALRVLDVVDWKVFFEKTNRVEAILRTDPAEVYARMDFETCDAYRKVVEALAWATGTAEEEVANMAIARARAGAPDERRGHVGNYLVGDGRRALEEDLGYEAVGLERLRRTVTRWPTASYLGPLAFLTWAPLIALGVFLERAAPPGIGQRVAIAAAVLVCAVPASAAVVALLQSLYARLLPPRTLPKLDLAKGLPDGMRTLVVIPTLLGREDEVRAMLRQVELHYLSNRDPQIELALLTDDVDAKALSDIGKGSALRESAVRGIEALNEKHGKDGHGPFHLLHRHPRWNEGEERFMGWERKRGKLEELNRLLRGDKKTSYTRHIGDPRGLEGIRFVITLDSDTELPMGSAQRLVGLLAHPLNRAVFEADSGRVTAGYTIVQPRIETSPSSGRPTLFSRLFAGDVGFDIYTHACSELYQDLFGSGIYVGKGIYDVDAFMRSVEHRVPENALVSHDLFEGIHGRTALATDIILFESYPKSYATYTLRMHRWVRGDWQLFPWLFAKVPSLQGAPVRNRLSLIDRWKIADNLRRSMTGPLVLVLLVLGWTWLPGSPWLWTIFALALLVAPAVQGLARGWKASLRTLGRCGLAIAFLAHEAMVAADAAARTVVRRKITGKNLLQWTTASHAAFGLEARSPRVTCWQTMAASPILAVATGVLVAWARPEALWSATPLLVLWLLAPELARRVSHPERSRVEPVTLAERRKLRLLARRTWRFFDVLVGPNDQWLPVDNYQEEPREQTAHRTSPTNIGLMLLATLSAYDFGYVGPGELSLRTRMAMDSLARLSHYRGHLFNWYDTRNLQPLLPRYVSTVDSGNLAGCLLALKHGLLEAAVAPVVRAEAWAGLADSLELLDEVAAAVPDGACDPLRSVLAQMQRAAQHAKDHLEDSARALRTLCDETAPELDRQVIAFLETGMHRHEADLLHALRTSIHRLHQQLQHMRRELHGMLPWLALAEDAIAHGLDLPAETCLQDIPVVARRLRAALEATESERRLHGSPSPALDASAQRLDAAFRGAETGAAALAAELHALAARADEEVRGMDFKLLYDSERRLFHIGHDATSDHVDPNHYDLLASEARLASYLAIVKRDVPESHWFALGRPMTRVEGAPALLSWGGTMFEYLMPSLLMRSQSGTLLAQTCALAVQAQIAHGRENDEPWGVSESAYARVDADQTYQYRSFGVPGLGFKRGLEEDRVVAPYASILAVAIRPRAVVDNLSALEAMGMVGEYGLFESLDLTPERVADQAPPGQKYAVVRSYMAHHQGMLLVALGNFLNGRSMIDRFHADPLVETGEALLNEQAPGAAPPEWPVAESSKATGPLETAPATAAPAPWASLDPSSPQAFVLGNGRLSTVLTGTGGGGLSFRGLALTRYEVDPSRDDDGLWFHLRDEETHRVWRATSAEGRTTWAMHKAELHLRCEGISVHVDVAVAASDDVEVRQITLHNETERPRRLTVTSAGRPLLFDAARAAAHPAFASLFVESERLGDLDALLFARRPQNAEEEPAVLVHRLVREGAAVSLAGFETDRGAFLGRCSGSLEPLALVAGEGGLEGRTGAVLDPIMSLMARVELAPKGSVTLAFVTTVARSRSAAVELARKYGSMHAVRWTFRDAERESPRRLLRARLEPALLPAVQRLFSALLFADPSLRAPLEARAATPPRQRLLWGRGISGDEPIVLLRVGDPEAQILGEVLAAQRYLRSCDVRMDVVLVDEQASGYATEGSGTLRAALARHEVGDWLARRGGVFVIAADKVPANELRHLEACARVLLDTRDGSLAARMARLPEGRPTLPRFEPALAADGAEVPRARSELLFDNGTGGFTADGREYVITVRPGEPTPAPWCNVLANQGFGCLVSESSLGMTWSGNSGENRLTPWRNDPVSDTPSEVLYLRDEETAAVWSPTPLPAGRAGQTLVRHGAGYTVYERESHGLRQSMTVFVPPDAPLKIVRLRLRNTLTRHRRLTVTYHAEWVLGTRREVQRPHIVSEMVRDHACLLATCEWTAEPSGRVAFLASKDEVHGFSADRAEILGRRGDYALPEALERWGLSGRVDLGADPCATLQVHIDLAPGQEVETHFLLGQSAGRAEALELVRRFRDTEAVDLAWGALTTFWDELLGTVRVATPEPSMDVMLNRWLLYQALSSRVFGRTGFYQSSGAFGFRDQLQDVLALLLSAPEIARAHILDAASHQFEAGDVQHWWHPPAGAGVRTRCSDDMAWLPYVTSEYVASTGDVAILDEQVPFLVGEPLRPDEHDRYARYDRTVGAASLLEHCRRAIERAATEGAHGLPLMGDGDWNDGMSRIGSEGRGESVWLGWFLSATMDRFASLALRKGEAGEASKWETRGALLRKKTREVAWDGAWYLRAFHDDGSLVGSRTSRECRIDSIVQSWAVLSGGRGEGADERTRTAVGSADAELVREDDRLVLLFRPPFDTTLHNPGYVRAYPPGIRENGGQYTHAATWLGFAHAKLRDGASAERIFRLLNPILHADTALGSARYRVEPYALAADVYGSAPWVGRGGWTWYTGAAAWMWRLGVEAILGLRRQDGQLRVDPCIPKEWPGFEAWIRLNEQRFHIVVENPERVSSGVAGMTLDGERLGSNRIDLSPGTKGTHEVRVRLGVAPRRSAPRIIEEDLR